jgi:hypothetical protein
MDMLETGNYGQAAHANGKEGTMTATEYKTEFSMWAIAASPLVVTTPIMTCTAAPAPPGPHKDTCSVKLTTKVRCDTALFVSQAALHLIVALCALRYNRLLS